MLQLRGETPRGEEIPGQVSYAQDPLKGKEQIGGNIHKPPALGYDGYLSPAGLP